MKKVRVFFLAFLLYGCTSKEPSFMIEQLRMLSLTDTAIDRGSLLVTKNESFLVKGYHNKDSVSILEFAKAREDSGNNYTEYIMFFYKESKKTNPENITKNPKIIDRYSNENDLICTYHWNKFGLIKYETKEDAHLYIKKVASKKGK